MTDFIRDVTGISALGDDLRRELYLFVSSEVDPVGREQAARALGIPVHQAKFHLDRLEEAGLLKVPLRPPAAWTRSWRLPFCGT